jgi:hypothetical protein
MRTRTSLALAALAALALAAGCLGGADDGTNATDDAPADGDPQAPPEPDHDFQDAIDVDHPDHQNPDAHTADHGLSVAGHTGFEDLYGPDRRAGWTEVDVRGDLAALASYDDGTGAVLVNVSDPANPEPLSVVDSAGVDQDARLSPDGEHLFVGCQPSQRTQTGGLAGDCRSREPNATTDEPASGVVAYDVADPTSPTYLGMAPGVGTHNLWTATIDGEVYVFTDGIEVLRFDPDADPVLEQVASMPGRHDAFVHEHPVTGDHLLYTGAGDDSFSVYNVSDPTEPQRLVDGGFDVVGWHEQTASPGLVDGRALLVVGGEVFQSDGTAAGAPVPAITVVDVTDPEDPEPLGDWQLPVSQLPPWTNYRWSPHNIDVSQDGQVSVAWNHAGIWVFDASTQQRQEDPITLAFHQPTQMPTLRPPTAKATGDVSTPRVWGGLFHDGYLLTADMYSGFYALEPGWTGS